MILSHRWFSAAVVATLAMGIGLNTMVFTLVNAVLLKPVGVPGGARLMAINYLNPTHDEQTLRLSMPDLRDYRAQAGSFDILHHQIVQIVERVGDGLSANDHTVVRHEHDVRISERAADTVASSTRWAHAACFGSPDETAH